MILQVVVEQDGAVWRVRSTSPDSAAWIPIERSGIVDGDGYPLPPAAESASWTNAASPLCIAGASARRSQAYNDFLRGDPRAGMEDVEAFGGYLFALLLGESWTAISNTEPANDPIRIQLFLPVNAVWWQLPWELMVGVDSRPLAVFRRIVAITRMVDSGFSNRMLSIAIPIRMLFVVGRELDDELRPGAEYVALLRQLRCTIGAGNESQGIALHARILMETTTQDLKAAVEEFLPTVVHIVSHGQVANDESVVLLTKYEGSTRTNPKADPVNADRLADLLYASDESKSPKVVVLNACNTGQIGNVHASFVAALVRRGVPLALGMAGEVADSASRLFTTQFYAALADQQPLDVAAAEGRRAALLHFKNYSDNYDWGRAVFCQTKGVEPSFRRLPLKQNLLMAAERFRPKAANREVFCGRYRWLEAIQELCREGAGSLAIGTDEELPDLDAGNEAPSGQLGKSRLLEEVAFQSLLDEWVPVHITQKRERFLNMMDWAVNLFEYMEKARELFRLARRYDSELVKFGCQLWSVPSYSPGNMQSFLASSVRLATLLQPQQRIQDRLSFATIAQLLQADIEALRKDIEEAVGQRRGILLLWDQLDIEDICEDFVRLLGPDGLGSAASPVPVIFTHGTRSPGGKRIIRACNDNSYVQPRRLGPFDKMENGMAVRQFLAWKKFVANRSKPKEFQAAMDFFERVLGGYPSRLSSFAMSIGTLETIDVIRSFDGPAIVEQSR